MTKSRMTRIVVSSCAFAMFAAVVCLVTHEARGVGVASETLRKMPARAALHKVPVAPADEAVPLRTRLAWQIALDRAGYSPGVIDGNCGGKTAYATAEFQRTHSLAVTGKLDSATSAALGVAPDAAIVDYTVEHGDLAQVGPNPKAWLAKSRLKHLGYPSLDQALAEKFHCSRALLSQLNGGRNMSALNAGATIKVPAVSCYAPVSHARRIDVNFSRKVVRLLDGNGQCAGMFYCSIAKDKAKLPSGRAHVAVIARNPTYRFDPRMYPEVKSVKHKLLIPPGPRNPVGLCWVGLNLSGYGIHGTPNPELIGKTGSHGCIRLANWDAVRLGGSVTPGTPVTFSR